MDILSLRNLTLFLAVPLLLSDFFQPAFADGNLPETNDSRSFSRMECEELKSKLGASKGEGDNAVKLLKDLPLYRTAFQERLRALNEQQASIETALKTEANSQKKRALRAQLRQAKADGKEADKRLRNGDKEQTRIERFLRNSKKDQTTIKKWLKAKHCK
jgi:predicted  nucleic acid-binding Zn-ribbon protein